MNDLLKLSMCQNVIDLIKTGDIDLFSKGITEINSTIYIEQGTMRIKFLRDIVTNPEIVNLASRFLIKSQKDAANLIKTVKLHDCGPVSNKALYNNFLFNLIIYNADKKDILEFVLSKMPSEADRRSIARERLISDEERLIFVKRSVADTIIQKFPIKTEDLIILLVKNGIIEPVSNLLKSGQLDYKGIVDEIDKLIKDEPFINRIANAYKLDKNQFKKSLEELK